MTVDSQPNDVQVQPALPGHVIGFADARVDCAAMKPALNQVGVADTAIAVLHGEDGVQRLEDLMGDSQWGESAEEVLKQGTIELRDGGNVVIVEVQNADEATAVAAIATQCGIRSIYHFGTLVDTRLTQ